MEKLLKTIDIYGRNELPETRLWKAVLGQLVFDAFTPTKNKKAKLDQRLAQNYCENPPWNFGIICQLAGYDPEYIAYKLRKKVKLEKLKEKGIVWNT
jgi:hypothetical protein